MHDGIVKVLLHVLHFPDLAKNLISLGTLEINGCKFIGENGIMKISRDAFTVMKPRRSGSLYVLQGKPFTTTTIVSISSVLKENTIKL